MSTINCEQTNLQQPAECSILSPQLKYSKTYNYVSVGTWNNMIIYDPTIQKLKRSPQFMKLHGMGNLHSHIRLHGNQASKWFWRVQTRMS